MKEILNGILDALENVGSSVDALEGVLVRRRLIVQGDLDAFLSDHRNKVQADLARLRSAVQALEKLG